MNPPLFLAGATATGKSQVALRLAKKLSGEIISVDSMQVYRGLDIGTAKPSAAERAVVPHHLIDVVDLNEGFDVARFVQLAQRAVKEIQARKKTPIFCGGTGLYFRAFMEGLGEAPSADATLRAELESTPLAELLDELKLRDPVTHEKIDRQNPRRVIRALEVIRLTGKPFSEQRAAWVAKSPATGAVNFFSLSRQPADLLGRIDARVEKMFSQGLVDEVKKLLPLGLAENATAMQAIGYRQVVEHLRGERTLPVTIELIKIRTRQFAKRQATWFKKQEQLQWLDCKTETMPEELAEQIISRYNPKSTTL